jgi:hypothetical protein
LISEMAEENDEITEDKGDEMPRLGARRVEV